MGLFSRRKKKDREAASVYAEAVDAVRRKEEAKRGAAGPDGPDTLAGDLRDAGAGAASPEEGRTLEEDLHGALQEAPQQNDGEEPQQGADPAEESQQSTGPAEEPQQLTGSVEEPQQGAGSAEEPQQLTDPVEEPQRLAGSVEETQQASGPADEEAENGQKESAIPESAETTELTPEELQQIRGAEPPRREKTLRRMSRLELVDLIYDLASRNRDLEEANEALRQEAAQRQGSDGEDVGGADSDVQRGVESAASGAKEASDMTVAAEPDAPRGMEPSAVPEEIEGTDAGEPDMQSLAGEEESGDIPIHASAAEAQDNAEQSAPAGGMMSADSAVSGDADAEEDILFGQAARGNTPADVVLRNAQAQAARIITSARAEAQAELKAAVEAHVIADEKLAAAAARLQAAESDAVNAEKMRLEELVQQQEQAAENVRSLRDEQAALEESIQEAQGRLSAMEQEAQQRSFDQSVRMQEAEEKLADLEEKSREAGERIAAAEEKTKEADADRSAASELLETAKKRAEALLGEAQEKTRLLESAAQDLEAQKKMIETEQRLLAEDRKAIAQDRKSATELHEYAKKEYEAVRLKEGRLEARIREQSGEGLDVEARFHKRLKELAAMVRENPELKDHLGHRIG